MKTRCPCCGATLSLDALINHDAGRLAIAYAFKLGGDLGAALVRYLALFRPAERDLTFERVAKLLDTLLPDIENGCITRRGQTWLAPRAAWSWAINQMCETRAAGRLTLPLKSHGFLYEVITQWKPEIPTDVVQRTQNEATTHIKPSQTRSAITVLEERLK